MTVRYAVVFAVTAALSGCDGAEKSPSSSAATAAPEQTPSAAKSASAARKAAVEKATEKLAAEGQPAPKFEAVAHDGTKVSNDTLKGKNVVIYFYPKDDTPGCTIQAKGLRDEHQKLAAADTVVLGVSTQDNESHEQFAKKYDLPFLLLPDENGELAKAFGVPVNSGYASRITFIIGKDGKVARVFPKVVPNQHAAEVLKVIDGLKT